MRERCGPLVSVGLLQALLGFGLDGTDHLARLILKRQPQLALAEQKLVHAAEDTDAQGRATTSREVYVLAVPATEAENNLDMGARFGR
jgi:hypothetical protein